MTEADVIDTLAGIEPGSRSMRSARSASRRVSNAQASYLALFAPDEPGDVSAQERFAVATFVAGLHAQPDVAAFYRDKLAAARRGTLGAASRPKIGAAQSDRPIRRSIPTGRSAAENADGPDIPSSPTRPPPCSARGSRRRSRTRTCWCSIRATPRPRVCRRCSMPDGRPPASSRCRSSSRSCRSRSASSPDLRVLARQRVTPRE